MPRMLIIDDEPASCRTLALHFGERGFDVETAHSAEQGLAEQIGRASCRERV